MAAYRRRVAGLAALLTFFVYFSGSVDARGLNNNNVPEDNQNRFRRAAVDRPNAGGNPVGDANVLGKNGAPQQGQFGQGLPQGGFGDANANQGAGNFGGNQGGLNQGAHGDIPRQPFQKPAGDNLLPPVGKPFGGQGNAFPQAAGGIPNIKPGIEAMNVAQVEKKPKQASMIKLSTSEECAADVQKFCSRGVKDNNFSILDCLQSDDKTHGEVSPGCQNYLWQYKRELTMDDRFDSATTSVCHDELAKVPECKDLPQGKGVIIPCLIEHFEEIGSRSCQNFLNKMASIIFSDYRFIYRFAETCQKDIATHQCGRLDGDQDAPHSQGKTVACLAQHMAALGQECKKQVLRVFELQSDDFHLDRPLYYACQEDRENLCPNVKSGNGAVFQCLFDHLGKDDLTAQCREKLELRQQLMDQDVKVEHLFYSRCKKDIDKYNCLGGTTGQEDLKRADILLCLEKAHMDEQQVQPECVQEMLKVRERLMSDYRISPELMARCQTEIHDHCDGGLEVGGKTLHCLMKLARKRHPGTPISSECRSQLSMLLKEANVAEDFRLDKPLQLACSDVVTSLCSHVQPGHGGIINCLMENLDEDEMTDECEERLLEIQFFVVRDFKLDPDLYKNCKRDARKLCHETGEWWTPHSTKPESGPLVLSCLHRHYFHHDDDPDVQKLSRACEQAVRRVIRQRAVSVDLNPEIEDACRVELGDMCSEDKEDTEPGAELECLQMNFDSLGPTCKKAISEFTEDEAEDIHMDRILMKACTPMIKKFCDEELDNDAEPDEVLECLIEHKNHADMVDKCRAGIEHHQLISLKDFKFNHKFKEACHRSVQELCKAQITKYDVVSCLSEHVRNDTLLDRKHRVEPACRKQLKAELLQRGESIKLDPQLEEACESDIKSICSNVSPGNAAVLECLKKNQQELTKRCHKLIFKREKDEFAIADYALVTTCKKMIRKHCGDSKTEPEILDCLKRQKDDDDFDDKCRRIVVQRQITQARDYRLNPLLQKGCQQDIPKFCKDVLTEEKNDENLEGKVINCLKKQFAVKRLSASCEHHIRDRVKAAAMDIRQAPVLFKTCKMEIKLHCKEELSIMADLKKHEQISIQEEGQGRVIECLKDKFRAHKIQDADCKKEIASLLAESHVDVNVDPLLHTACQRDLLSLCQQVPPGQGRQMSCLLSFLDEDPRAMTGPCREMLSKRKEMWEYAAQVAPPESFGEIYESIVQSPAKNYFVAILFTVVGVIFIVGLTCGRVTKRVRAELKNK
ncbi:hypothetical protein BaRGS_00033765 [Batillaria attramentaria]|uniref:Golgi apparatus protein 1 n=1 Tax=Batillaria attramentaria TaxID=370345 RepID=A0ABD0JJT2_9CAEN